MGWFSDKKKIKVYSSALSLAGEPKDHVNYLSSAVAFKVLSNSPKSMAQTIQETLMNGQGMQFRAWAKWCNSSGYRGKMGISGSQFFLGNSIDNGVIQTVLPTPPTGSFNNISKSVIGAADYGAWVDRYMMENHPSELDAEYTTDFDDDTLMVTITFEDGRPPYTFYADGFVYSGTYLYVNYTQVARSSAGPVIPGTEIEVPTPGDWPPTADWESEGASTYDVIKNLTTTFVTDITYSDGRPAEHSERVVPRTQTHPVTDSLYTQEEFIGSNPDGTETNTLIRLMHQMQTSVIRTNTSSTSNDEVLPGGVIKTTKVVTLQQVLEPGFTYRIDTQIQTDRKWSNEKMFIYQYDTGKPQLDAMFGASQVDGRMYPFIPIKYVFFAKFSENSIDYKMEEDHFLDDQFWVGAKKGYWYTGHPLLPVAEEAYKKLFRQDYKAFTAPMKKEVGLLQADTMYIAMSIPLNVGNQEGKKYLFQFFDMLATYSAGSGGAYSSWRTAWTAADVSQRDWLTWKEAQAVPTSPLFGTPEPARSAYPPAPGYSMRQTSSQFMYDMSVEWSAVQVTEGTGLGWAGAKSGQVRIQPGFSETFYELIYSGGIATWTPNARESFTLTRQVTANSWKMLTVYDLVHRNQIYKGKGVSTRSSKALSTPSTTVSNLMIPLHEGIYKAMSLKDSTQLTMSNSYMVLNSYDVVTISGFAKLFKVVMIVVVIVITVVTAGAGAGSAGLLGPALTVGTALGFAGTVAIIVGSVANALAAMLLTQLITMGAQALFGDKIGAIVGMIASIVAINYGTSVSSGTQFSLMDSMSNSSSLLKLTQAVGGGYAEMIMEDTRDVVEKTQDLLKSYELDMEKYQNKWNEVLGDSRVLLDPLALLGIQNPTASYIPETPNSFFSRTLLSGSEIADMTNTMITNFADINLSTSLPL